MERSATQPQQTHIIEQLLLCNHHIFRLIYLVHKELFASQFDKLNEKLVCREKWDL